MAETAILLGGRFFDSFLMNPGTFMVESLRSEMGGIGDHSTVNYDMREHSYDIPGYEHEIS
jgi:hypothetical protein